MILGALIDAGVPLDGVRDALGQIAVERDIVWTERVMRAGIRATKLCVRGEDAQLERGDAEAAAAVGARAHSHQHHHHEHGTQDRAAHESGHAHAPAHAHEPPDRAHHHHRTLAEIRAIIDRSA